MSVKIKWNSQPIIKNVKNFSEKAIFVALTEWKTDSNRIAPQDRSELIKSSGIKIFSPTSGALYYDEPYAFKLHEHPEYNFSRDVNPYAQGKYLEDPLVQNYKHYIDIMGMIMKGAFK